MGRKLNLKHLSEAECEHILKVVHKDFNLRYMEKERLKQIEEDVQEEETRCSILSKSSVFNEKHCICCFSRFLVLFNPRILCDVCSFHVCKDCVEVEKETKKRCCKACMKQRKLRVQSNEWFYTSVERKFKRCGSAKVIRSLYKRHVVADDASQSLVMMSHSDSDSATVAHRWRSENEDIGKRSPRYGATLSKSLTLANDAICDCGMSPCSFHPLPCPTMECARKSPDEGQPYAFGQRDLPHGSSKEDDEDISCEELKSRELTSIYLGAAEDSTESPVHSVGVPEMQLRADSCSQTEREDFSEVGTMTVGQEASRCFPGFDGMATVSTEGHEVDPLFVMRPHNIRILEGEPLTVECTVSGTSPLDVLWFCNRNQVQQLEEDDRCEIRRHGNIFSLTIYDMRAADSLEYLCIAVNAVGQCAQGFTVTVDDNAHVPRPPEFNRESDNTEIVPEGSDGILRCSVSAYPEPKVTWFKNNKKLSPGGRYRIERHVPGALQYSLVIEAVRAEDSGAYSAVAKNVAGEERYALQLLVQPRQPGTDDPSTAKTDVHKSSATSSSPFSSGLLSNEDELMRLAQGVSRTQGHYTTTATRMLRSADVMSSMQSQLDEMDRALQGLEGEVLDVISDNDEDFANNNNSRQILDDFDDMNSSAEAVGMVTSAALQLLSSAKEIAMEKLRVDNQEQKQEELEQEDNEEDQGEEEEECVDADDLDLSYHELEKLYKVGLISRSQLKHRLVQKRNIKHIHSYLKSTIGGFSKDSTHGSESVVLGDQSEDCVTEMTADSFDREADTNLGWKKNSIQEEENCSSSSHGGDGRQRMVKSGTDSDGNENLLKRTEQQIYLTSGKVFSLEDCIRDLERQVLEVDENTPAEMLASLENSVARAVAQVTQSDREVNDIELQVERWLENSNRDAGRCNERYRQQQQHQTASSISQGDATVASDADNNISPHHLAEIIG